MNALDLLRRRPVAAANPPLVEVASALSDALEAGADRLDPAVVARARSVVAKVDQRTAITGGHTVVALAGATGSGKSSLFNAVVGELVSTIGARRPTSSTATAAIWGHEPSTELLDWLRVDKRHHVDAAAGAGGVGAGGTRAVSRGAADAADGVGADGGPRAARDDGGAGDAALDGLVLLDLPDFDSRVLAHRAEADRVLDLVDVFVWVTDPQKYADARLHEDYVARLAGHRAVTVVVLNQADRLSAEAVEICRRDLSELLVVDGIVGADVIATSARTGSGVSELRRRLADAVRERTAAERRMVGDIRSVAGELRTGVADTEPNLAVTPDGALVDALLRAAGIPTVLDAVERDYRRGALARTGWPFTRWARSLRPDPLRRLGLAPRESSPSDDARIHLDAQDVLSVLGRSSLPPPAPSARAAVGLATHDLADRAGAHLPRRWADSCSEAANPHGSDLADALDQAVVRTPLRGRQPIWWTVVGWLQWLFALCAVAGFLWLVVLGVLGWLRFPDLSTPQLGPLPDPFVLFVGGMAAGLMLAALARAWARAGGRRRRAAVGRLLRDAVSAVAQDRIVAPVQQVLDAHARTRTALEAAGAGR
jgi:GTP-binding protein EngB required for normal cell division